MGIFHHFFRFLSDRLYRRVIGACAVILVVFAGYFLYIGMRTLLR